MLRISISGQLTIPGWRKVTPTGCLPVPGTGTFQGHVFQSDGITPAANAVVWFCRAGVCYTTIADGSGLYISLAQISAGTYTIRAGLVAVGFISSPGNIMPNGGLVTKDLTFDSVYQDPRCP